MQESFNYSQSLSETLRAESAPELGGIEGLIAEFDLADRPDRFTIVLQKLKRSRQNIVPELLSRLDTDDLALSKKAALALGYLRSPQSIPALAAIACDPERAIFPQAMTALSHIASPEAFNLLISFLRSPSIQIQAAAARVLGKSNLTAAAPLVDALREGEDLLKINAAHSLGQLAAPLAVNILIEMLKYPVTAIRLESAWALAQIRSPLAAAPLAALLTDPDIGIQSQAAIALKNIGEPALNAIATMLEHPSSNTRSIAARTLGQIGLAEAVPLLAKVIQTDQTIIVLCEAIAALGEIGASAQSYDAVFYLAPLLKHSDRAIRNAAIRALKQINSQESQEVLRVAEHNLAMPSQRDLLTKRTPTMDNILDDMTVIQW
jgi:HEAT repeat protein